jgi:hypothetical protein
LRGGGSAEGAEAEGQRHGLVVLAAAVGAAGEMVADGCRKVGICGVQLLIYVWLEEDAHAGACEELI